MITFSIETLGCKVNSYDTGLLQKKLQRENFLYDEKNPEVFILNTCAVTSESTKEALRWVRRKKRDFPFSKIVLTGCSAQVDTDLLTPSGADLIVANSHKSSLPHILKNHIYNLNKDRVFKSNIFKKQELEEGGGEEFSHTRSFLKIQDGCNSFCTFCVIPFARGKSRSLPSEGLIEKIFELYEKGVREVVLTGVHIGDYEGGLAFLVSQLLLHTPMPRFRLSSLEPIELTDELLELYTSDQMCKHFHMSIQSLSTPILKAMKRKYSEKEVLECFERIHKKFPGAFVGMDVIAGFPTETESQFLRTYKNLKQSSWSQMHVFPYSSRPHTFALKFENLSLPLRAHRAKRLRTLSYERFQEVGRKQIGTTKKVLVLKNKKVRKKKTQSIEDSQKRLKVLKKGLSRKGLSRDYWKVLLPENQNLKENSEIDILIKGFDEKTGCLF